MLGTIFTFVITYLILSVCWFLPDAGTSDFKGPAKKELFVIALIAAIPTFMMIVML